MSKPISVLVTGATGKQGGAVARLLLKKGHLVRALTRKPDSPKAQELKRLGAELVTGNLEDRAAVERAARAVDAVFAMSTPFEAGMEVETRQGITVADAAKAAGVKHLIYTSVASADRNTGIPHFDSKYKVEQHIKTLGIPHTIIGPVFFAAATASTPPPCVEITRRWAGTLSTPGQRPRSGAFSSRAQAAKVRVRSSVV